MGKYEYHNFKDKAFPVTFHFDILAKNQRLTEHWHEHIEILYCVEGEAEMVINTKKVPIKKGGITVINPRFMHYPQATGEAFARYYCLIPSNSFTEQLGLYIDENEFCNYIESEEINNIFERIIKEIKEKKPYYQNIVKAEISSLLSHLKRDYCIETTENQENEMIRKGIEYMEEHYKENIQIDDITKATGYSRYYFSRQFKKIMSCTVTEYIKLLRCTEAKRLLRTSDLSVSDVATECGFDDISYFTKVFKNQTGVLPSHIKKEKAHSSKNS